MENVIKLLSGFSVLIEFFLFLGIGFFGRKLKAFNQSTLDGAVSLLVKVGIPCSLLAAAKSITINTETLRNAGMLVIIYTLCFCLCILQANLFSKLPQVKPENRNSFIGTITFKNVAFLGFPLCLALLGEESRIYTALCLVIHNVFSWSYGVYLYSGGGKLEWKKIFGNIAMISSFIMIMMAVLKVQLPAIIQSTLDAGASICTPLSLICMGIMLARVKFKELLSDSSKYLISFSTLIIFPLITFGILQIFRPAIEVAYVLLLLSTTPAATTNAVMAKNYGSDEKYVSLSIMQTMLFSIVTIPIMSILLMGGYS